MSHDVIKHISQEKINELFEDMDIHPLTAQLLVQRGIESKREAERFINPSYDIDIGNPFDIHGMGDAVKRIIDAMKNGETIAIYSDYDCDGIPGGVLLRTFFADIGYPVEVYVPHRHNEGYGLHNHAIDSLKKKGVTLIITVDLAITNIDEVKYAKEKGVDIIVTDHHLPIHKEGDGQVVPDAVAVINSKQYVCNYHDDMLCGCAVAWKLLCALLSKIKEEANSKKKIKGGDSWKKVVDTVATLKDGYEKWLLDLVGISTVADMVPLVKENRALAYFGLKVLRMTKRHGLNHIFRNQGVSKENLTEDDIAFTIAPRINAAGRMGDPIQAHNMLFEKDNVASQKYVDDLEALNVERKQGVKDITEGIDFDHSVYDSSVIVVGDLSWGPGILGLIAQKIIDETGKPTFVYGQGDDKTSVKGSCRSRGDVHVVELMTRCIELFPGVITHAGGHEQAGGFSCALDRVGELSDALNESLKHVEIKELGSDVTVVHASLNLNDVNLITHNAINVLAPFGVGNPKPLFAFKDVLPLSVRWFGKKGEHLEVIYPKGDNSKFDEVKAIIFFATKELEEKAKKKHTLLAHIEKSVWRGKTELRLRIKEIV
ncbi:single-stranded-DNA-specific exonuclease RecJ [Candidatus Gracilibacteria bacterium]|nr:single-stranded-DNA-specific exonuclease RecJ [Candidatus Gracilibacteria bacterium]